MSDEILKEQIREILQCRDSILYFADNYTDVELSENERDILLEMTEGMNVYEDETTSYITSTMNLYVLWRFTFYKRYIGVVFGTKADAKKFIKNINTKFVLLPQWMRPEVHKQTQLDMYTTDGSQIIARAVQIDAFRGRTFNTLIVDAVDVSCSKVESMLRATLPVIYARPEGQCILRYSHAPLVQRTEHSATNR